MVEYGVRTRELPAPPHVVWDDLAAPRLQGTRAWLALRDDEVEPTVVEGDRPTLVVWSSLWPSRPVDVVRMELSARGEGTALRFVLLGGGGTAPDDGEASHIRRRVNELLFADLRYSYGQ